MKCRICGKTLKSARSIAEGVGPVCGGRNGIDTSISKKTIPKRCKHFKNSKQIDIIKYLEFLNAPDEMDELEKDLNTETEEEIN